jgi:hypothetical protein
VYDTGSENASRVNGNRKLISCRQVKFDQFGGSLGVGGFGVDPAEVSVF